MNSVDIILAFPLLFGLIMGFYKGFIEELVKLMVIVLGLVVAYFFGNHLTLWLAEHLHWADWLCRTLAYTLIFLLVGTLLTLLGKLIEKVLHAIHLNTVNKILGAVFGVIKWAFVLTILVMVFQYINTHFGWVDKKILNNSVLYSSFLQLGNIILTYLNTFVA